MRKKRAWCLLGLCVMFVVLVSILPQQKINVHADTKSQLYALEITTGAVGTDMDKIQSIVVNYKEKGTGNQRVYAIFPKTAAKTLQKIAAEPAKESRAREQALEECGEKLNGTTKTESFLPYTAKSLFFYPYSEIGEVTSIKILTTGTSDWSIQGMRLVAVNGAVSLRGSAAVSSQLQEVYSGTRIMEMKGTLDFSWTSSTVEEISSQKSSAAYLEAVSGESSYQGYQQESDEYIVRLDLADTYLTGLESLATESNGVLDFHRMAPADLLYTTIYYEDVYGDERVVKVPVISNMLAECQEQSGNVIGLAQQGDTLAFSVRLYGFKKLLTDEKTTDHGIDVTVGSQQLQKQLSLTWNGKGSTEKTAKARAALAQKIEDDIALTNVALYQKSAVSMNTDISSGMVKVNISGTQGEAVPAYYYSYKKSTGRLIQYGQTQKFTMKDNTQAQQKMPVAEPDTASLYLVEINTADMESASTIDDLKISFTYKTIGSVSAAGESDAQNTDFSGMQKTSNQYSVKELVAEYYGYWPANGSDASYFAYHEGTQAGGAVRFLVSLSDVDSFVSVNLALGGSDEWQSAGVRISRVKSFGARTVTFEKEPKYVVWGGNTTSTDRTFDRTISADSIAYSGEQVLIRANKSKNIYFSESKSVVEEQEDTVWNPANETMTYEQACSGLDFSKSRISYDVDVTVAGANAADSANGDSGSKNLFYFRLNFENGSSAYVLANQQLSADGFRTGQTERFQISMNQDYGELVSVDIIPDDTGSNSAIYDKLNIARIRVNRNSNSSLNRSWEISNPGWIGIDYVEEGEKNSSVDSASSTGRYAGEITSSYPVDKTSYNVKLMFSISTAAYEEGESQFSGSVMATLRYTDTANESQTMNFDMVSQMYNYAQITPGVSDTSYTSGLNGYQANTSFMFRENSTDRFFLDLADVKSVDSLSLKIKDINGTVWNINNVGVSLVSDMGQMVLNSNNEYVYTGTVKELTMQDSESVPAYQVDCSSTAVSNLNIGFQPNEIDIKDESAETASATITRKPTGKNDTLNIFVFPQEDKKNLISDYDMELGYRYVNAYGRQYENAVKTLQKDDSCFYILGISSRNFSLLKGIDLKATALNGDPDKLLGKEIIIQHVRSGVVIDTYRMDIENQDLSQMQTQVYPQTVTNNETQTVSLYFGEQTKEQLLEDGKTNIAVSIGYKNGLGNDTRTYHSPYVFLTDQNYRNIYANKLVDIDFHVPYMSEITDIQVAGTGDIDATIESAVVATYKEDTSAELTIPDEQEDAQAYESYVEAKDKAAKNRKPTGWYSFKINKSVSTGTSVFVPTNSNTEEYGTLIPVTVDLQAAEANASTENDLSLVLRYTKTGSANEEKVIVSSVRKYMGTEGSFAAGEDAQLQFMLEDVDTMIGMELQTVHGDSSYALATATVTWNNVGTIKKVERYVNDEISTRPYTINFVDASLYVETKSEPADGTPGVTMNSEDQSDMSFGVKQGDTLDVSVDYQGISQADKYNWELYQITGTDAKSKVSNESEVIKASDTKIKVHTKTLEGGTYELHIIGGLSKKTVVVKFTVTEPVTKDPVDNPAETDKNASTQDSKKEDTERTEE